jgi:hypothetical protein
LKNKRTKEERKGKKRKEKERKGKKRKDEDMYVYYA